jgi:hypothetical protein
MSIKTTSILRSALLSAAVASLAMLAPVGSMAQGPGIYGPGPTSGPYGPGVNRPYYSRPEQGVAPRPDFPGAKQFDPADPAFLGVGSNRSAAMGMTAGGAKPSQEELAKHRAYVQSLRQQEGPQYKMPQ